MSDNKELKTLKPVIVQGAAYDFWLNDDDDNYDKKYGENKWK